MRQVQIQSVVNGNCSTKGRINAFADLFVQSAPVALRLLRDLAWDVMAKCDFDVAKSAMNRPGLMYPATRYAGIGVGLDGRLKSLMLVEQNPTPLFHQTGDRASTSSLIPSFS